MDKKREMTKHYSNEELSVVWKPHLCFHAGYCFEGLPQVFDPRRKPWIEPLAASSQEIRDQVAKCPSGALTLGPPRSADAGKGLI